MRSLLVLALAVGVAMLAPVAPVAPVAPASAGPAPEVHPEWGSTSAPNGKLKRGCHRYEYSYAITPPEGDWSLETFLYGRSGKQLGSGYFQTGADPLAGTSTFRLCRPVTKGGRYTIRALVSVQNGPAEYVEGYLPDSHFRLKNPQRR